MYDHEFTLRKVGIEEWELVSEKGFTLTKFDRVINPEEAMMRAKAWASSWTSISIRMEDEKVS